MPQPVSPDVRQLLNPRRSFGAWWSVGSLSAGALAVAFLPVALLSGEKDWAVQIDSAAPIWAVLCVIGVACGIRGMRRPKRLARPGRHWVWSLTGLVLSLVAFVVLTIIAVIARW